MVFGGVFPQVLRPAFDAGAAFVGAYDAIPSIVAAYGMRRLRTAYTSSILRLRRSSDNAEQDIGYTVAGDLDTAAVASFIGAGSGYVRTWYDQSGNAYDASQTTADSQPLYVASGQNGRPVGRWDGTNDKLDAALGAFSSPTTIFATCYFTEVTQAANGYIYYFGSGGGSANAIISATRLLTSNNYSLFDGAASLPGSALTSQTWMLLSQQTNISSVYHKLWKNGVADTVTDNDSAIVTSGIMGIGYARQYNAFFLAGDIAELIICNAALSDANRQAAEAAANNYWAVY